jgi:hypothetical protein
VPINPNPVSAPVPVSSQAPPKPEAEQARPGDRRDAIQRAFDRAEKAEPRKARMGDNNPPEPMEREKPKRDPGPPIDLKKRPDDQPATSERSREPQPRQQGRFVPREQQAPGAQQNTALRQAPRLPVDTPYRDPPRRWDEASKAAWHATPEPIRAAVHRSHQELGQAYQQYRGDHEVMNTIRPFHEMASQHGTTLERALNNYVSMEQKLRSDPIGGIDIIISNLNLRTSDGKKLTSQDVAWHILNQSPEQNKLVQQQNAQTAQSHQIGQLHQMVQTLAKGIGQMQYEKKFTNTRSALDQYANKHPRFDELGDLIEHEIKLGFDLDTAYRRAELLRPSTHAAQTRTQAPQTRSPDRSIHGAPAGGPQKNGHARRTEKPVGRREAIANAMKRANGSL